MSQTPPSYEELVTQYIGFEKVNLRARFYMGSIALRVTDQMGVALKDFAADVGACSPTMREYRYTAKFYAPEQETVSDLIEHSPLFWKHFILAKRGYGDLDPAAAAHHAVVRLQRWAKEGISVNAARIEVGGEPNPPRLKKEHEGSWAECEAWLRSVGQSLNGRQYRVAIYKVA